MRIPYPERFEWKYVFAFMTVLFLLQLAAGTNVVWALLIGVYMVVFTAAFNAAGGLFFPSGAWIFFTGVLVLMLGVTWKALLFEPGESHLHQPFLVLLVYLGGMFCMYLMVLLSKRFTPKHGLLSRVGGLETYNQAAIGCMVLGFVLIILFGSGGVQAASIGSAVAQINHFPPFAIMLATTYEIKKTNGRRAWNWVVLITSAYIFIIGGLIYTSKEGMFTAPITWLLTAAANGYRFKPKQILLGLGAGFFLVYYMVPYSQYVRNFRDKDGSRVANQRVALEYIFRLNEVRTLAVNDESVYLSGPHFYSKEQGLMDRLCMIAFDDALVDYTEDGHEFGLWPTYYGMINTIPKFVYKNKPDFGVGNTYGREIGVLGEEDLSTGISFSVAVDAYHEAKWFGVFVILPLVCFGYFLANDTFTGSVKESPWGLLLVIFASHSAPEGMIPSMMSQTVTGSVGITLMALTIRYVFPLIYRVMTGGEKTIVRKSRVFHLQETPMRRTGENSVPVSGP